MNHPFYQNPNMQQNSPFINQQPRINNIFIQKFQQFRNMLTGNPEQIARSLLASGEMTQEQFNQYAQTADQLVGRRPF